MNSVVKKAAIYSMVGILQLGIGGTVFAAPSVGVGSADQQQVEDKQSGAESNQSTVKDNQVVNPNTNDGQASLKDQSEVQKDQDQKDLERLEDARYKKEIQRKPNESDADWQKRLEAENQRHEENLKQIRQEK